MINRILIPNLHNNTLLSWFLMKLDFFLPKIAQFDTSINLFCLVPLTLRFLFTVFFIQLTQYVTIVFVWYNLQHFHSFWFFLLIIFSQQIIHWSKFFESIKVLEIKTLIIFNFAFSSNTVLSSFFPFSWWLTYAF